MTNEERREYMKKYRAERGEQIRAMHNKYNAEHKEERNARYRKKYAEHIEERREYSRKYRAENLNSNGVTKSCVRVMSGKILKKSHTKLPGYEIHHCFGYENPGKFIYIPKSLHLKIHQLLRDKKIPSDSDHWNIIRDLVNSCEEYTYIKV